MIFRRRFGGTRVHFCFLAITYPAATRVPPVSRAERQLQPVPIRPFAPEDRLMRPIVTSRQMRIIFDVHQYKLVEAERQMLEDNLDGLARQVEHFPVADLHVLIEGNARSNDVSVKLDLILPGSTLVANDHDPVLSAAFERCLNSLSHSVDAYKAKLDGQAERQKVEKGTLHDIHPTRDVDLRTVEAAVSAGDYAAFRAAMLPFEDAGQADR